MNSWPSTSPFCMVGTYPSIRCRSEAQVVVELLSRVLTEVAGNRLAELARRELVSDADVHLGALVAGCAAEFDGPFVGHVSAFCRLPGELGAGDVFGGDGIPFHGAAE